MGAVDGEFLQESEDHDQGRSAQAAQLNLIRGNVNSDLLARRGIGGIGKLGEVPTAKSLSQDSVSITTSHPFFWAPFNLVGEGK